MAENLKKEKLGCTEHKSPQQIKIFFHSLISFYPADPAFFEEQVADLTPKEKIMLIKYLCDKLNRKK